jgi:methylamine dehydrogenase heavy chain
MQALRYLRRVGMLVGIFVGWIVALQIQADIKPEVVGREELKQPTATWLLARDGLGSFYIFDAADGNMQGLISATPFTPAIEPNIKNGEFYAAESYYSRGSRGERTDVVTVYDLKTLRPKAEIEVPNRIAALPFRQYIALMDDEEHLAVFNITPAQSVSIVNVKDHTFVGEISTPGCALIMQTAGNGFLQICGDGRLQLIRLDSDGKEADRSRSKQVFDIEEDPFFDKPIPTPEGWLVISYLGQVFDVSVSGDDINVTKPWSLLSEDESAANWRPGGGQFVGYHESLDLLFVLMNAEGGYSHDSAGTEVWVYNRAAKRKIGTIPLEISGANLRVSQTDTPLLTVSGTDRQLHVYDVVSTKEVRTIAEVGVSPGYMQGFSDE